MRTPEQVKQARKDLEALRNANHLRREFIRIETERLDQKYAIMNERQAKEDAEWNELMMNKQKEHLLQSSFIPFILVLAFILFVYVFAVINIK